MKQFFKFPFLLASLIVWSSCTPTELTDLSAIPTVAEPARIADAPTQAASAETSPAQTPTPIPILVEVPPEIEIDFENEHPNEDKDDVGEVENMQDDEVNVMNQSLDFFQFISEPKVEIPFYGIEFETQPGWLSVNLPFGGWEESIMIMSDFHPSSDMDQVISDIKGEIKVAEDPFDTFNSLLGRRTIFLQDAEYFEIYDNAEFLEFLAEPLDPTGIFFTVGFNHEAYFNRLLGEAEVDEIVVVDEHLPVTVGGVQGFRSTVKLLTSPISEDGEGVNSNEPLYFEVIFVQLDEESIYSIGYLAPESLYELEGEDYAAFLSSLKITPR